MRFEKCVPGGHGGRHGRTDAFLSTGRDPLLDKRFRGLSKEVSTVFVDKSGCCAGHKPASPVAMRVSTRCLFNKQVRGKNLG